VAEDNPDQHGRQRHPQQLVPVEEGEAEQGGKIAVVERNPQQGDEGEQQEQAHFDNLVVVLKRARAGCRTRPVIIMEQNRRRRAPLSY
jgi:hypothetical protein